MKNLVLGMSIYFETPTQRLLTLGENAYERGLVMWDEERLWQHPSQDMSIYTSNISLQSSASGGLGLSSGGRCSLFCVEHKGISLRG
jgi:hypothetical protein